jgi:hypothetical protein
MVIKNILHINVLLVLLSLTVMNKSDMFTPINGPTGQDWVTHIPGDGPIIIIAGHDGTRKPTEIPDRHHGCWDSSQNKCLWKHTCPSGSVESEANCKITTSRDTNTYNISKCLQQFANFSVGTHTFHPHFIYNSVNRTKIDTNREVEGGCLDDQDCINAWTAFHGFINTAVNDAISDCDFALVIDIHGHNQNNYTMLGYDISETQYNSDANLNDETHSTIEGLQARTSGSSISSIVRGANSLGQLLYNERTDRKVTPSQTYSNPNTEPGVGSTYFQGDYVVDTYGSGNGAYLGKSDSIQIEIPQWIRTKNNFERDDFCQDLSNAIVAWVTQHWHSGRYSTC